MQKSIGFHYGDEGMYMETQGQQYAFHEESWSSDHHNNHHKHQFSPGMHMKPAVSFGMESKHHHGLHGKLGGGGGNHHGMFHDSHGHGFGGQDHGHGHGFGSNGFGKKFPFGGGATNNNSHHQFSKFNNSGGDFYSEESEEFEAHSEEHHGHGNHHVSSKVDEMKYERHQFGGGDVGYAANPYGGGRMNNHHMNMNMNMNMNHHWKPHGGPGGYNNHKIMWTAKGV